MTKKEFYSEIEEARFNNEEIEENELDLFELYQLECIPDRIFKCDECNNYIKDCYCRDTRITDIVPSV